MPAFALLTAGSFVRELEVPEFVVEFLRLGLPGGCLVLMVFLVLVLLLFFLPLFCFNCFHFSSRFVKNS